jgi:hypothetical protein
MNRLNDTLRAIIGLSIVVPFFLALAHFSAPPHLFDLAFGLFPLLALAFVTTYVVAAVFGRQRDVQASTTALVVMAWSCVSVSVLSFFPFWNDGSYLKVLPVGSALTSILTLGILPFHAGPEAVVRFVPVAAAIALFFRLRRTQLPIPKRIVSVVVMYLFLSIAVYSLSWVSGILAVTHADVMNGPADVSRILTTAQADGYWTRGQQDRFFAPIGTQSDNSFAAIQTSFYFLMTLIPFGLLAVSFFRSGTALAKRLASRSSVLILTVLALGLAIGMRTRTASSSYTDGLAFIVAIVVFVYWVAWWRFVRDLQTLPKDEQERPDLPLPSGTVAVNDLEAINGVLLTLSLIGAFVLGWPVFVSLVTATIVASVMLPLRLENLRADTILSASGFFLVAVSTGSAAVAVGLRDASVPDWMIRIVLSMALLVALERLYRRADRLAPSRFVQAGIFSAALMISLVLANQRVFWLFCLPAFAVVVFGASSSEKWQKYRRVPTYILLGGFLLVAAIVPQWIVQN